MASQPRPPRWLITVANVLAILSCTLLIMYLIGRLECNRFVRLSLAIQIALVLLTLYAFSNK